MKCPACNYEYYWEDKGKKESFILLDVVVNVEKDFNTCRVGLVACPKCNCVIMNDN